MKIIEIDIECNVEELEFQGDIGKFIRGKLNGYMEIVHPQYLPHPLCMVVDEEGLLKNLETNPFGSFLYRTHRHGHPIVGKIYIVKQTGDPFNGYDITGLTDSEVEVFHGLYDNILKSGQILHRKNRKEKAPVEVTASQSAREFVQPQNSTKG